MRMSCNGCRVLRKGCTDSCTIRPCLIWITSPASQAHATLFLAKFYGRAGLINLLNSGPQHLRPAIFRSLLYEACGRMVDPVNGSAGLLCSGNWQLCQDAVEAVLRGSPITTIPCTDGDGDVDGDSDAEPTIVKGYDIRHVSKDHRSPADLHRVRTRPGRFKRTCAAAAPTRVFKPKAVRVVPDAKPRESNRSGSSSHESSMSHETIDDSLLSTDGGAAGSAAVVAKREGVENAEVVEAASVEEDGQLQLELTLGLHPVSEEEMVEETGVRC